MIDRGASAQEGGPSTPPPAASGSEDQSGQASKAASAANISGALQAFPSAAAPGESLSGSHSWLAVPALGSKLDEDSWRLLHVTPRRTLWRDGVAHGSDDGVLRPSVSLASRPRALAAVDNVVYILFPTLLNTPDAKREVYSVSVMPTGVADLWADDPPGAARREPSLEGSGILLGFVGTQIGPVAMVREASTTALRILRRGEWIPVPIDLGPLTDLGSARPETIRLVQSAEGFRVVLLRDDGSVWIWNAALEESTEPVSVAPSPAGGVASAAPASGWRTGSDSWRRSSGGTASGRDVNVIRARWNSNGSTLPSDLRDPRQFAGLRVISSGGQLLTAHRDAKGDVLVGTLWPRGWLPLTRIESVPAEFAFVSIDGLGRCAVVWQAVDATPQETGSALMSRRAGVGSHLEIREVSAWTGRLIFQGASARAGIVGAGEFRLLALSMFALMAIVLTLIVRREEDEPVFTLPDGVAMCEPGRRAVAGVLDLLLVFVVASRIMGISPLQFFDPGVLLSGLAVSIILLTVLLGAIVGTLTEAFFARSPGKLLVGCEVLAIVKPDGGPPNVWGALWRAAVRNLVKWGLPPLGVLGVLDPSGRHRGDHMAGTLVIVRFDPDEEDADGGDDARS